jgi:hypothetical protein
MPGLDRRYRPQKPASSGRACTAVSAARSFAAGQRRGSQRGAFTRLGRSRFRSAVRGRLWRCWRQRLAFEGIGDRPRDSLRAVGGNNVALAARSTTNVAKRAQGARCAAVTGERATSATLRGPCSVDRRGGRCPDGRSSARCSPSTPVTEQLICTCTAARTRPRCRTAPEHEANSSIAMAVRRPLPRGSATSLAGGLRANGAGEERVSGPDRAFPLR